MQQFGQSFILALKSIKRSKMRAFLTMLGIIIGIAAVIIITSLGNGLQTYMTDAFDSMGTNLITVNVSSRGTRSVNPDDMFNLATDNPDVLEAVSPSVTHTGEVTCGGTTTDNTTSITGVSEYYNVMKGYDLTDGRFLSYMDIKSRNKVCVIGTYVANTLFGNKSAVGQTLKIGGNTFTVIGTLAEIGDSSESSSDDCIYIPYSTAQKLSRSGRISSYTFSVTEPDKSDDAKTVLENELYEIFQSDSYYTVTSLSEMLDTINSMMDMVITILSAIAAISLAVGGVGIMNIMLVSVTERTREIGIRKSLGAKRRNILSQFVIEAMTISALGGILGMITGVMIAYPVGNLFDITAVPKMSTVLLAFSISVAIGILFGYLPASKASKLNPIDALRHD